MSRVLLTGATGFVGMEVLARLLERTEREVMCLVRAADHDAAEARLDAVLATLYDDPAPYRARVSTLHGDLTSGLRPPEEPSTWSATAPRRSRSTCRSRRRARSTSRARARCSSCPRAGAPAASCTSRPPTSPARRRRFGEDMLRPEFPTRTSRRSARRSGSSARRGHGHRDRPPEHRHGRVRHRLDPGLQRPVLAAARVRPRPVRAGAGAARRPGRRRAGRLRRRRHRQAHQSDATGTFNLVAGGRPRPSRSSPTWPARTSTARARRTRRRAARRARRPTSTARSSCRTSTWRSCSTTPDARASSGSGAGCAGTSTR